MDKFSFDVLNLFYENDIFDELFWNCNAESQKVNFFVKVNDVFHWGHADAEGIVPNSLAVLKQAVKDCLEIDHMCILDAGMLYAAIMRRMRPQGAAYPDNKEMWPLLNRCGPEREVGRGNPYRPGEYKKYKGENDE